MKYEYFEPEFRLIKTRENDIMTFSGGDDFNTRGDQPNSTYYQNTDWLIDL